MTSPSSPLSLRGLSLAYGPTPLLEDVHLELSAGECVALLGASGSGKTSLLRSIAGFLEPSAGEIRIDDRVVHDAANSIPPEDRGVGMVFQDYALFAHMTVAANIAFGIGGKTDSKRVHELLSLVDLKDQADRRPAFISGGQQQRTALARALAPSPRLLLFDEPFANLDAALRGSLARELRDILARENAAALVVTHDRDDAFALADRVAVLGSHEDKTATLLQCASAPIIYRQPINCVVAGLGGPYSTITGQRQETDLVTPVGTFAIANPETAGNKAFFRPEDMELRSDPGSKLCVVDCRFLGRGFALRLKQDGFEGRVDSDEPCEVGSFVSLRARRPLWILGDADEG